MRNGGIQSTGHKLDYNAGTIKRKPEEDDFMGKVIKSGVNLVKDVSIFFAQNPQASDQSSASSTAYRS